MHRKPRNPRPANRPWHAGRIVPGALAALGALLLQLVVPLLHTHDHGPPPLARPAWCPEGADRLPHGPDCSTPGAPAPRPDDAPIPDPHEPCEVCRAITAARQPFVFDAPALLAPAGAPRLCIPRPALSDGPVFHPGAPSGPRAPPSWC